MIDDTEPAENWSSTALAGAKGFVFQRAVDELAPLALKTIGLDQVADFLFPEVEAIDYDKIANIIANSINSAIDNATIREQNATLETVIECLRSRYLRNNDDQDIEHTHYNLTHIIKTLSDPGLADMGITTYTIAANTLVSLYVAKLAADPSSFHDIFDELNEHIDRYKAHIEPYMANAVSKRLAMIRPSEPGDPHIWDSGLDRFFGEHFANRFQCERSAQKIRLMIEYQQDWSIGGSEPAFFCKSFGTDKWLLYVRDPTHETAPIVVDQQAPDENKQLTHLDQYVVDAHGTTYWAISGMYSGWGGRYIDSGNECARHAESLIGLANSIQQDAYSKHAWFRSFYEGWTALSNALADERKWAEARKTQIENGATAESWGERFSSFEKTREGIVSISIDPQTSILYAATGSQIMAAAPGAQQWEVLAGAPSPQFQGIFAVDNGLCIAARGSLYWSSYRDLHQRKSKEATWDSLQKIRPLDSYDGWYYAIAKAPHSIYVATEQGVISSETGGATGEAFVAAGPWVPLRSRARRLACAPDGTLFSGTHEGLDRCKTAEDGTVRCTGFKRPGSGPDVGVIDMAISPDGNTLVVLHSFTPSDPMRFVKYTGVCGAEESVSSEELSGLEADNPDHFPMTFSPDDSVLLYAEAGRISAFSLRTPGSA